MNLIKSIASIIIVLCLSGTVLLAQNAKDIVHLKNGDVLTGTIIQYSISDEVVIKLKSGLELTLTRDHIERIEMEASATKSYRKPKIKQWYNQTSIRSLSGQDALWGNSINGASLQNVTGYQFNKFLGLGLGLGYDLYNADTRQAIIPVFTEVRGRLLDKKVSPIYSLAAGVGFGVNNEDNGITKMKPGFMWNPALGFSIQGSENATFVIDLGYQFQHMTYIIEGDIWNPSIIKTEQDYHFKRLALRLGLLF